jgi:AraC-like DNA-binding protein
MTAAPPRHDPQPGPGSDARSHALRGLVTRIQDYDVRTDPDTSHAGVPGLSATVILQWEEPLDVGWTETERSVLHCTVAGLHRGPALIRTQGHMRGIQLDLTPAGTRSLLGLPISALSEQIVDGAELPHGPLTGLVEHLGEAEDDVARRRLLRTVLADAARRTPATDMPAVATEAWSRLTRGTPVHEVAAEIGYSRRRLQDIVHAEFGPGPKTLQRLARFTAARDLANQGRPLAEVAAATGYADQAHLTRDWDAFAGRPPRTDLASPFFTGGDLKDTWPDPRAARSRNGAAAVSHSDKNPVRPSIRLDV